MEQSTLLGSAWVLLHPLIVLSVFSLFFKARLGREIPRYPARLLGAALLVNMILITVSLKTFKACGPHLAERL